MNRSFLWMLPVVLLMAAARVSAAESLDAHAVAQRIDQLIDSQLRGAKIASSPRSDDAEFQRRVYLDLTCRMPPLDKVSAFLDDTQPSKRAKLIDDLLASPEYGQHLARYWAELFIKRDGEQNKRLKADNYRTWQAAQFNQGIGWDKIVSEMLTVDTDSPSTFFFQANKLSGDRPSPAKVIGSTGNLFMGIQLQCAECHNHPSESWKRTEFWELAAFFGRTRFENPKSKTLGVTVTEEDLPPFDPNAKGLRPNFKPPVFGYYEIADAIDPKKIYDTVFAKFPKSPAPELSEKGPHRPVFATWLTDPKNPWFARAAVNRYWSILFARGLVDPLDNMNSDNPPTHPEVLDFLTAEFIRSGHDIKHLMRSICNSETYQRTSRSIPENRDQESYARMSVKLLQGEVLLKILDQVLGVEVVVPTRNKKEVDVSVPNAELFDTAVYDEGQANYSFGAPQMLRLMNAELPRRAPALIARLQQTPAEPAEMIERLFLLTVSRRPTADEAKELLSFVKENGDPAKGYAGVLWILLSSAEFVSNH